MAYTDTVCAQSTGPKTFIDIMKNISDLTKKMFSTVIDSYCTLENLTVKISGKFWSF